MRNIILQSVFYFFLIIAYVQVYAQEKTSFLTGTIDNYAHQPVYVYQCYGDTLLLVDSVKTDSHGKFTFSKFTSQIQNSNSNIGLYRFNLPNNQWFYILNDGNPIQIKTVYQFSGFYNIATDSLLVLTSEENKRLYEFQHLQQKLNIANYWLLQMMRLYPLYDPFHKQIEEEYTQRYKAMEDFIRSLDKQSHTMAAKIAKAYYIPVNPDWKQPDPWRDSIIALHYFDYFNPADSFYLHTNILPEKLEQWLSLPLNNTPTSLETPGQKEEKVKQAADAWMQKVSSNQQLVEWSLSYLFKTLEKQKMYDALYFLYNKYVQSKLSSDCEPPAAYKPLHEKMSTLKNIQLGSAAPNFEIEKGKLSLYNLPADYTLVLFWATWCPHCTEEVPKIRDVVEQINEEWLSVMGQKLMVVAVSLDTDHQQWQQFVTGNNLLSFINFSEYKGWQSEVVKQYNVYATPTMFLLDKNKKIIAKPETAEQLMNNFYDILNQKK